MHYWLLFASLFFLLPFLRAFKACCNRNSICPLVLLNSVSAQASISLSISGLTRNTNAFFSAIVILMLRQLPIAGAVIKYLRQ